MRVQPSAVVAEYLATATADASRPPRCVIISGPTATGKTRHRREKYSSGYALVDAAAIFVSLAPDEVLNFPEGLRLELEAAGQALASAAVHARVDIVTEVIGTSLTAMTELIDSLRSIDYAVAVEYVHADIDQAWQWNLARSDDNISAYYAEEFNIRWLVRAAQYEAQAAEHVSKNPEVVLLSVDSRAASAQAECLAGMAAFPMAIQRMRDVEDESDIPTAVIFHTREAFAKLDSAREDPRIAATAASDQFYRQVVQLTILDRYTRAYVSKAIRDVFGQLKVRGMQTFYILDNSLREDRFQSVVELFELAGVSVVSPRLHGEDWHTLSSGIRSALSAGSHLAYIEPDAVVDHIEVAKHLARQFACITIFRNLAPEDTRCTVLAFRGASH